MKEYYYAVIRQTESERHYYLMKTDILAPSESEIIRLFVLDGDFDEDGVYDVVGVKRLTKSQYKMVIGTDPELKKIVKAIKIDKYFL